MLLCAALESLQQYGTVTFISLHADHGAKKDTFKKKVSVRSPPYGVPGFFKGMQNPLKFP